MGNGIKLRMIGSRFIKSPILSSILVIGLASLFITLNVYSYSYDDAYVTFRYSYNFATGSGLVYQPGESTLSTTAPVYALLLGVLALPFPEKIPLIAGWVSGIGLFAGALGLYIYAHRKGQDLVGFIAALSYTTFPFLMEMFGGEVIPLTALILWAFITYDEEKFLLAGILLGVGAGFRVDALIPFVVLSIHYLLKQIRIPWRFLLGFGVPYGTWVTYSAFRYGSILPLTLTAKLAQTQSGIRMPFTQGAVELIHMYLGSNIFYGPAALPIYRIYLILALVGVVALFIRYRYWLLFLASELLLILGYVFLGAPFYHWYFLPVLLISAILIGSGLGGILALFSTIFARVQQPIKGLAYGVIVILIAVLILPPVARGAIIATENDLAVQNPYPSKPYWEIGHWIAENTAKDVTVGHIEIGIIGYTSMREMVDPAGLVTSAAIEHVRENDIAWAYREYLPDVLVVNHRFSGILGPYQQEPWFDNCYKFVHEVEDIQIYQRCNVFNKVDAVVLERAQVANDQAVGEILPQRSVGQTFIARQDQLRAIGVLLATYGRQAEGLLTFHIQEVGEEVRSDDLARVEIDLSEVEDNAWRVFSFPPIENASGRIYYFYLESPQTRSGEAITAWSTTSDTYPKGTLFIEHTPQFGDLSFMLYYVRP
jgi:arabinofuranosyltransferase